jgi:hypothetical protein
MGYADVGKVGPPPASPIKIGRSTGLDPDTPSSPYAVLFSADKIG